MYNICLLSPVTYSKVPPVNVVVPHVAETLAAGGASALNKGLETLKTAVHPPAKALGHQLLFW